MKPSLQRWGLVLGLLILVGCASYQGKLGAYFSQMREGQPMAAASSIKEKAEKEGDDQVVYLLEYATALQAAHDFKESNQAFLKAEDLTEIKDYHSLSRITGSMLLNEGLVQYKGEDYEKILINAMLAVNFLSVGDLEAAQVETRKINHKLKLYRTEAKKDYEQNPFAFYLSAMIWEENRNWDSAYIDYKRAYDLNPQMDYIKGDLIRAAKRASRQNDFAKWKKKFPSHEKSAFLAKKEGEVVLIFQQGWAPEKRPHPDFPRIPKLFPKRSETAFAKLVVEGGPKEVTQNLYSVQDVAIKTMDDAYAPLIAKRMAALATKAVVADQIRQKDETLGQLAWLAMNIADRADLRQWASLPQSFQMARIPLKEGSYRVQSAGLNDLQKETGEVSEWREIKVKAGKRTFIFWRAFR